MKTFNRLSIGIILALFLFSQRTFSHQIVLNSIPKCGTHLLLKCLHLMTGRDEFPLPGFTQMRKEGIIAAGTRIIKGHFVYNENNISLCKKFNLRSFLIIRDPRDQIISKQKWIAPNHEIYKCVYGLPSKEVLKRLILDCSDVYTAQYEGPEVFRVTDVQSVYDLYLPWQNEPNVLVVRFEDLVGPRGGGSAIRQLETLRRIANHLDINLSDQRLKEIALRLFGGSFTFRKGVIGQWKEVFDGELVELFKQYGSQLLIDLGYERDINWFVKG